MVLLPSGMVSLSSRGFFRTGSKSSLGRALILLLCLAVVLIEHSKVSTPAGSVANDIFSGVVSLPWLVNETSAERGVHISV